jgi:integrase
MEQHRAGWKDEKHPSQWMNTLKAYAFPAMGPKRVDQIETSDVLRALSPIWLSKPETARRVRQRIKTVLDWAKAAGYRTGDNPVEGVSRGLPRQNEKRTHFAAIFLMILRRMSETFTAHGFRSAFRDWASECTNFPREVCEMALAHAIKDKTEAAYRRGDLFAKRAELMAAWAEYSEGR